MPKPSTSRTAAPLTKETPPAVPGWKWNQEDAIACSDAKDYLAQVRAIYVKKLAELRKVRGTPPEQIEWLTTEIDRLWEEERSLKTSDVQRVAEILRTYGEMLSGPGTVWV